MRDHHLWGLFATLALGATALATLPAALQAADRPGRVAHAPRFGKGDGFIGQFFTDQPEDLPVAKSEKGKDKDKGKSKDVAKDTGKDKDKSKGKDKDKDAVVAKEGDAPLPKPPSPVEQAASTRAREESALLRRLSVCDKLKEIAYETKDDDLDKLATQLDERARMAYSQRIAHLPVGGTTALDADEQVLEKQLGDAAARGKTVVGKTAAAAGTDLADRGALEVRR